MYLYNENIVLCHCSYICSKWSRILKSKITIRLINIITIMIFFSVKKVYVNKILDMLLLKALTCIKHCFHSFFQTYLLLWVDPAWINESFSVMAMALQRWEKWLIRLLVTEKNNGVSNTVSTNTAFLRTILQNLICPRAYLHSVPNFKTLTDLCSKGMLVMNMEDQITKPFVIIKQVFHYLKYQINSAE